MNVVICGICKDVGTRLPASIKIVESVGSYFSDYRVLIYENNSTDNTRTVLKYWQERNPRVSFESEDIQVEFPNKGYLKSNHTAYARNRVVDRLWTLDYHFDYVIWIDLDFVLSPDLEGIREALDRDDWDAVFAYGISPEHGYWDWLAFRDKKEPFGPELIGHDNWYVKKENLLLSPDSPWYPVYSAFGGFGLYKKEALRNQRYSAMVTQDIDRVSRGILVSPEALQKYLDAKKDLATVVDIEGPVDAVEDKRVGFRLWPDSLIYHMNSFVHNYPATCDHVPVHFGMIAAGYKRLFVSPRIIFRYGDR